jgi:hypothetical protein
MATLSPEARSRKRPALRGSAWLPKPPTRGDEFSVWVEDVRLRASASTRTFKTWWNKQTDHLRLALAVVAFAVVISLVNATGVGRVAPVQSAQPAPVAQLPAPVVVAAAPARAVVEGPPIIPGKAWNATQLWQGSGSKTTESFTVGSHWRVDWLYNPPATGGVFQVFIYSAEGALLMDMAANTQKGGPDTSFWAGPGTYFLKVNVTGGDWKLDVQDLR